MRNRKMLHQLSQRAALQAMTLTPDGGGGYSEGWQTFASVWVKVAPAGAADAVSADTLASRARHRAVIGDRTFKIHAVLDEGKRAVLITLLCEELP